MIDRLKALKKLDRKRLDATLMRIHGRPSLMVFFNLVLLGINSLGRVKSTAKSLLSKAGLIQTDSLTGASHLQSLPLSFENRVFNKNLSVLIVCETSIEQCFRYRVKQKLELLDSLGIRNHWVDWTNYLEVNNQINFYDVVIFYRVPGYPKMLANIDYANQLGKIVIYDTDDLIFDRSTLESYYDKTTGQLSARELKAVFRGADLYRTAIERCGFAITTTTALKQSLEQVTGEGTVFILPNGLDQTTAKVLASINTVKQPDRLILFYGSGTKTHDQDFALIAPALEKILANHKDVDLVIAGYLTLPDQLNRFSQRITKLELLQVEEYLDVLAHADINLAPLAPGLFADCKSEIKWLEAAALSIPTVASATQVFKQAISHGENGFIAGSVDEWYQCIDELVSQQGLRLSMGKAAGDAAKARYSIENNAQTFVGLLSEIKHQHLQNSGFSQFDPGLQHIVIVNVLYPPQAMGGATVVAQNIVETICADYSDRYHVSVFTCDVNNIYAHQVTEYEHNGVSVTAVSVPVGPDVDYREYDSQVGALFAQFIQYKQPDLIHFHCIQRLTGSILEAAHDLQVPFLVTVHDAWWLSDHQFLVDKQGQPVNELQSSPIVAAQTSDQLQRTLQRRRLLTSLLNKAARVLAVSDYQQAFYQKNGVTNVIINKNGVDTITLDSGPTEPTDKVIIGYTGSICHHKGYYFLKQIVENNAFKNIEIKVIQFNLNEPRNEVWGATEVDYLPKFDSKNMVDFYSQIDVLIAPSMWPESFGLITREAALVGIWVIASEAGGLAEVIEHGKNGFKFTMGNADELTDILRQIDNHPQTYKQRTDQSTSSSLNINTVEQQVKELVDIYAQILN